jgi:hypothetical protein
MNYHDVYVLYLELKEYKAKRASKGEYTSFAMLSKYNKLDKIIAVDAAMDFISGKQTRLENMTCLRNGSLGHILRKFSRKHGFGTVRALFTAQQFFISVLKHASPCYHDLMNEQNLNIKSSNLFDLEPIVFEQEIKKMCFLSGAMYCSLAARHYAIISSVIYNSSSLLYCLFDLVNGLQSDEITSDFRILYRDNPFTSYKKENDLTVNQIRLAFNNSIWLKKGYNRLPFYKYADVCCLSRQNHWNCRSFIVDVTNNDYGPTHLKRLDLASQYRYKASSV